MPGSATATRDVRHPHDSVREQAVAAVPPKRRPSPKHAACSRPGRPTWRTRPSRSTGASRSCSPTPSRPLATPLRLPSGAGHDAVAMADLTAIAMLFVRCAGGLSHHPGESVRRDDVVAAIAVLARLLSRIAG